MPYQIALTFEDGATRIIDCSDGETVLDAAFRNKINLPMDCSDGVCGTCKCRIEAGEFDLGDEYLEEALTEDDAAEGMVLTCQMTVSSDCIISVPVPSVACKVEPKSHSAVVTKVDRASDSTFILTVAPDAPDELAFLPGQYVNIKVPGTDERRSYSMSTAPGAEEASFLIRNIPGGVMSSWLTERAATDDRIEMIGPRGSFFLRSIERPVIMLAGGTGLAPILSMLEVLTESPPAQPIHLIYGVTTDGDLVEVDRLDGIADRLETFTWSACVADPESGHPLKGYVTDHLSDAHLNAGDCDIYLCGPPPMVEAVREFLSEKDIAPANFHYEKFLPNEAEVA